MVKLGDHELDKLQICEDVPNLVKLVTSSLSFDIDAVLAQLSPSAARFRRRKGKRSPSKAGYYLPSRSGEKRKEWFNWRAARKTRRPNQFATFLNEVTDKVREFTGGANWKKDVTDLVYMEKPKLKGPSTDMDDVPDFVLVERGKAKSQDPTWNDVRCVGALRTEDEPVLGDTIAELGEFARRCFTKQHKLRFILGLVFFINKTIIEFCLVVFDRSGTLCSQIVDIDKNPIEFLRGAIGLPLLSPTHRGGDPTFLTRGDSEYIQIAGLEYKVLRYTFANDSVNGKGTRCFEVEGPDGERYAARDSWTMPSTTFRESEFLDLIKDVENVPRIVKQEIVSINSESGENFLDSTKYLRASISEFRERPGVLDGYWDGLYWKHRKWIPDIRDHLRTLIYPCGQPLTDFSSLPELLSAALDILETVEKLDDRGMWHSDISSNNIILVPVKGSSFRKGYLIDFETAVKRDSKRFIEMEFFTTIMTSPDIILRRVNRNGSHEAESVLYVLLFIAMAYEGSGGKHRQDFNFNNSLFGVSLPSNMNYCRDPEDRKARARLMIMEDADKFKYALKDIGPYFNSIKGCLSLLRDAIFCPKVAFSFGDNKGMPFSERLRIHEEQVEQRIKSILTRCKGILRETIVELTSPKTDDQSIPQKIISPSCPEDPTHENGKADSGEPACSKAPSINQSIDTTAPEADLTTATVEGPRQGDLPPHPSNPDTSEGVRQGALPRPTPGALSPRRPLKRHLTDKDLNVDGDCPDIGAKRPRLAVEEVECNI